MVAQKYKNVLFVDADMVSSNQIAKIRMRLRDLNAYMIMGKNVSAFRRVSNFFYDRPS